MKIYKHRSFHQWTKSENITDSLLKKIVEEIDNGLYEANLGSGLYKKRVALEGKGKSGSYRVLIAFKKGKKAFFVYGFSKGVQANINEKEEKIYRQLTKNFLTMDEEQIQALIERNILYEVK